MSFYIQNPVQYRRKTVASFANFTVAQKKKRRAAHNKKETWKMDWKNVGHFFFCVCIVGLSGIMF